MKPKKKTHKYILLFLKKTQNRVAWKPLEPVFVLYVYVEQLNHIGLYKVDHDRTQGSHTVEYLLE